MRDHHDEQRIRETVEAALHQLDWHISYPYEDQARSSGGARMTQSKERLNSIIRRSVRARPVIGDTVTGELVVEAHDHEDAVIVVLAGEFDLPKASLVRETLTRAISKTRPRLILDLGELTFIDSSGLHVILDTYNLCLCSEAEPTLTIRPGPPNVQRVFEITNLLDYLPFELSR